LHTQGESLVSKNVTAAVVAALIVFFWQGLSWMALPFHTAQFQNVENEAAVAEIMRQGMKTEGLYFIPSLHQPENVAAEKYKAGPVAAIYYKPTGGDMMDPALFLKGFFIDLFLAAFILCLYHHSLPSLHTFAARAMHIAALGLLTGAFAYLQEWNWMLAPFGYAVLQILDGTIAWGLAGLA
jgi:hypothetical protein